MKIRIVFMVFVVSLAFLPINNILAFEIKGIHPGMDISKVDTKKCESVNDADSGIPGFKCNSTIGIDNGDLRILVFEGVVVGIVFTVKNGQFRTMLDALTDKFGNPSKPNRFMEKYTWHSGQEIATIDENRYTNGYSLVIVHLGLYSKAKAIEKEKAKGNL